MRGWKRGYLYPTLPRLDFGKVNPQSESMVILWLDFARSGKSSISLFTEQRYIDIYFRFRIPKICFVPPLRPAPVYYLNTRNPWDRTHNHVYCIIYIPRRRVATKWISGFLMKPILMAPLRGADCGIRISDTLLLQLSWKIPEILECNVVGVFRVVWQMPKTFAIPSDILRTKHWRVLKYFN